MGVHQVWGRSYKHELHANEVAILPYYVANLNIEATYAAISGQFAEFPNLCFVDTLDNTAGLSTRIGQQVGDLFGAMSEENVERVQRQNRRKISVVIGNPPYNAGQLNENDNNKNREYHHIDRQIKATYVKQSSAQKTIVYDMYARFFRWASDRLNDDGILAFITNRSFIDSRTFDGFRKVVTGEYTNIYLLDLGGDVRSNPKLSGTKHNVFGIQTGVAISFFIRNRKSGDAKVHYARRPEFETAEEKIAFLGSKTLADLGFEIVVPDKHGNWINQTQNGWEKLCSIANKSTKMTKVEGREDAIFKNYSTGIMSGRDEWVYDFSDATLIDKMNYFVSEYLTLGNKKNIDQPKIKLSRNLKRKIGSLATKRASVFKRVQFRPFVGQNVYLSKLFVDELERFQFSWNRIHTHTASSPRKRGPRLSTVSLSESLVSRFRGNDGI